MGRISPGVANGGGGGTNNRSNDSYSAGNIGETLTGATKSGGYLNVDSCKLILFYSSKSD